jgi:outer membrane protein assembly factor BamB
VFVADTAANCVRKIDTSGNVTAVAGGGGTTTCGTTIATGVSLSGPVGVGVDSSGNVYIGDSGRHCLRKVAGSTVTAFAGTGTSASSCATTGTTATSANLRETDALAIDSSNNVYVTDGYEACLYKVPAAR